LLSAGLPVKTKISEFETERKARLKTKENRWDENRKQKKQLA